jgi:O-antigen/teichoic acid export membrane protein
MKQPDPEPQRIEMLGATADDIPQHPPRRSLSRIIFRNTVAVSIGDGLVKLLSLTFSIIAVRLLGDSALGQYVTVIGFVGVCGVFFELGLSQYVERTLAQDSTRARSLFWNLVLLRLVLACGGMIIIPLLAIALGYEQIIVIGTLLYSSTFFFAAALVPLTTLLHANERFDVTSAVSVVDKLFTIGLGLGMLWLGYGFLGLLCIGFVAMPVQIGLCLRAVRRSHTGLLRFQWSPRDWPAFIRASLPFGLTSLALTLNYNADSVILGWFRSSAEVGWYMAAYRLVFSLVGLVSGFLVAFTPSIAREHVHNPERVRAWTRTSTSWLMLFALPSAVGVALLAPRLTMLLYGPSFVPAGVTLGILCWDVPLLLFTAFCGNVSAAVGLERSAARIFATSVTLNIILNLLCIPIWGKDAAAVVTLLTDTVSAASFFVVLHNHMHLGEILPCLTRIVLAALAMGAFIWLASALPLLVVIVAGALCYGGLAMSLGLIDQELLAIARRLRLRWAS